MKILIMVVSTFDAPYYDMAKGQQSTWDSVKVKGVDTVYYYSGDVTENKVLFNGSMELTVNCETVLHKCHWRFKLALDELPYDKYDLIFRTNNSSYVNKKLLVEFAETLPKQKCYCGIDGDNFASGSGFFISKDCIKILLDNLKDEDYWAEDHLYGKILAENGILVTPGAQRINIDENNHQLITESCYHYRCKHGGSRDLDVTIMQKLFEIHEIIHTTR